GRWEDGGDGEMGGMGRWGDGEMGEMGGTRRINSDFPVISHQSSVISQLSSVISHQPPANTKKCSIT
ncbi:MAG: hypothetical protein FWK04_32280, partial [Nostoc sp. GBBB01]|nr:hypothetical protein [Nostoc sp. GBBB01]